VPHDHLRWTTPRRAPAQSERESMRFLNLKDLKPQSSPASRSSAENHALPKSQIFKTANIKSSPAIIPERASSETFSPTYKGLDICTCL
jgi:hypothetical protein